MKNALKIGFLSVFGVLFLAGAAYAQATGANAQYVPAVASNAAAIPGRLSSEQMKAIVAAADEENRRAFSDLVQQTSAVPSALLSIQEGIRQKYPRMGGTDNCRGRTSELQRRLGRSLTPKQIDDIDEMNGVLMGCAGQYFAFAPPNSRNITASANQAVADAKRRRQQIESAKNAILQVEAALDAGDLIRANQLFRGLAGASSQPTFAQSYLQQTQSLRQDLGAYLQAVGMDHQQSAPLVQQLQNLGREVSLLNESASGRPLTQAYLQHVIKDGIDASRRQLANLPAFQFNEASYRIPTTISESDELTLISNDIKAIDESFAKVSETRAIAAQPELMKIAEEVVGGTEAATLKATADQIGTAEHMRASLVDTQNSLQTKIAAENRAREEAERERIAALEVKRRAEARKQAETRAHSTPTAVALSADASTATATTIPPSASTDSKAAIEKGVAFLTRHFVISDNSGGRLEPTAFHADNGHVIFEFDYSDPGKPKKHSVESAAAKELDPNSVRADFVGWLHVDCKNQRTCVVESESGAKNQLLIGPIDEAFSDKAKQYLRQILLMQLGQSPVAATKPLVDSHNGEQFYGWKCKNLAPLNVGRKASVELVGPVMEHRQESMVVTIWLDSPQEMAWRDAFRRSRYLGGPGKGKLMEDQWESHFTNGVKEATLTLSKGDVFCPSCPNDYEGWKFNLVANVPRQDDPTQLNEFYTAGTCNENWLKSDGKSSPVVQPKEVAQQ
jgi:hypothetical protein